MKAAIRCLIGAATVLAVIGLATPVQARNDPGSNIFLPLVSSGSVVQSNIAPSSSLGWMDYLNAYRALSGLPPLTENSTWSAGDEDHARYIVESGDFSHTEVQSSPYYTSDGASAGGASNIFASYNSTESDIHALNSWFVGPFHALGILDPLLSQTGFGSYRNAQSGTNFKMAAGLDVIRGRLGSLPSGYHYPFMWPGDGTTTGLSAYGGGESPNPLAPCSGYSTPTGLPIILQLGDSSYTTQLNDYSFSTGSTRLAACAYDSSNPGLDSTGKWILSNRAAIVLIPQEPLIPGSIYTVSITDHSTKYTWSFAVGN